MTKPRRVATMTVVLVLWPMVQVHLMMAPLTMAQSPVPVAALLRLMVAMQQPSLLQATRPARSRPTTMQRKSMVESRRLLEAQARRH